MTKFFIQLAVVFSLAFFAPVGQAHASLAQQQQDVFDALDVVILDLQAEIAAAQAELATLTPGTTAYTLKLREIQMLQSRLSYVQLIQGSVFSLSATALDNLIVRYDLPVSLS